MSKTNPLQQANDSEALAEAISRARQQTELIIKKYVGRAEEIETLEDEVISEHINSPEMRLSSNTNHVELSAVVAYVQNHFGRVAEIHGRATANLSRLSAVKNILMDALLPYMQGSSADIREAKTNNCTDYINFLIEREKGLLNVCETAMKNMNSVKENAGKQLKAYEFDLVHFGGSTSFQARVVKAKENLKVV